MSHENGVTPLVDIARDRVMIRNSNITAALGEFLGTFILCLFAVGAGCQAEVVNGDSMMPVFGGVTGLIVAITICGGASGAHINPAVTLGVAITGGISWMKVPIYWGAQFLGAYMGSGLAYSLYVNMFKKMAPGCADDFSLCPQFARVFAPTPNGEIGVAFADQVVGTALLVMLILAAIDQRNMKVPAYCYGPLFAITIAGINFAFGINAGGVLNPARDISARIMAVSVGFSSKTVFSFQEVIGGSSKPYWVAPLFGPMIGGLVAALIYVGLIAAHLKETKPEPDYNYNKAPTPLV